MQRRFAQWICGDVQLQRPKPMTHTIAVASTFSVAELVQKCASAHSSVDGRTWIGLTPAKAGTGLLSALLRLRVDWIADAQVWSFVSCNPLCELSCHTTPASCLT